jgi:hypothetical protein
MDTLEQLLFGPHAVLPVQFHPRPGMSPEKRLMVAVLEDALRIYTKYGPVPPRKHRRLFAETERWLFSDDASAPFAFVKVCEVLGIDVGRLRARLARPAAAAPRIELAPVALAF